VDYTTLILGAGVSKNYKFPLGSELISSIRNILPVKPFDFHADPLTRLLSETRTLEESEAFSKISRSYSSDYRFNHDYFAHVGAELNKALERPINSIDDYINSLREDPDGEEYSKFCKYILKASICQVISECEENSKQSIFDKDGIYAFLYRRLFLNKSAAEIKKVKVINFNYDRSFDYTMESWITEEGLSPRELATYLTEKALPPNFDRHIENLEILHPHGKIGELNNIPYATSIRSGDNLKTMASNILVVHEERDDKVFNRAKEILQNSKTILILGFGFDKTNVSRLELDRRIEGVDPWFSAIGLREGEIEQIAQTICSHPSNMERRKNAAILHKDSSLIEFIRTNNILRYLS
jgi:hypothetical protein